MRRHVHVVCFIKNIWLWLTSCDLLIQSYHSRKKYYCRDLAVESSLTNVGIPIVLLQHRCKFGLTPCTLHTHLTDLEHHCLEDHNLRKNFCNRELVFWCFRSWVELKCYTRVVFVEYFTRDVLADHERFRKNNSFKNELCYKINTYTKKTVTVTI